MRMKVNPRWIWSRKSIYKSIPDTVEEDIVTGGDDQINVDDFFENSEDEIKSALDDA